ncbi:MAG: ATP-binding protein [Acidobacteriota bacterium]|nr:ATP-binding protein [Acidobacteriota bacterium]
MDNYEKLGAFYLGRHYDLEKKEQEDSLLLYDSKDLVTHAVCVGMTGSGKTGLCVTLLEEAAIDGIPAIIVDPKGDLANLLLTFPNLSPQDFRPWINEDDARRKELSPDEFAAEQADLWKNGLASYGQSGDRIRRLRESAEFVVYTPGSEAGQPVSILSSFDAPSQAVLDEADLLRERISSTSTSLLGLLGIDADPIQSREHILLSTILDYLWKQGTPVDLGALIQAIQSPPIDRVGVMELDSFFPPKERFKFAMQVNNLLAAPSFQGWLRGQPLDLGEILHTPEGKPRVAIFSIAHLADAERMFFVSLLLNQTLSWMRSRPGTTSLRAMLYMDEIFGYMPPVAEPPSKKPLLTLLKQARAYGVGVVLATQNPVDLDYKGLSNTGTWFIGRLQTERDKDRVLQGLEGIAEGAGFDRKEAEKIITGLGKRVFLLHNVHEEGPVVFHTRWAMSYLRGPLTRQQIKTLMKDRKPEIASAALSATSPTGPPAVSAAAAETVTTRPVLPPEIRQYFVRPSEGARFSPHLLGLGKVHYVHRSSKKTVHTDEIALAIRLTPELIDPDWEEAVSVEIDERDLERNGPAAASFGDVPAGATKASNFKSWQKKLADFLYRERGLDLFKSRVYKLTSEPLESERDFRIRLGELARERRDAAKEKLRKKYETKTERLEERLRKARQRLEVEQEQAKGQKLQSALSIGATLLGAFTGRKKLSYTTLSRARTAAGRMGRSAKEKADIERASENIETLVQDIEELSQELESELDALDERYDPLSEELETTSLRPRRADVDIKLVALAWMTD